MLVNVSECWDFLPELCSTEGWLATMILCVVGALGRGYIGTLPGCAAVTGFRLRRCFSTVLGAIGVIVVYRLATR